MSEWPKSFYVPAVGKAVKIEDFERLLKFTVGAMSTIHCATGASSIPSDEQIRTNILKMLKMESERDAEIWKNIQERKK
jgi:hypothetical protein